MITRINTQAASRPTDLVGNTPLLELSSVSREVPGVRILGKAEWYNPGGSVKDRPALWMIRDGEKSGELGPGKVILDATSGNTGIAYAWIGASLGYRVITDVGLFIRELAVRLAPDEVTNPQDDAARRRTGSNTRT